MKVAQMLVAVLGGLSVAATASAALTLKLNPADLQKLGPGPLTAEVGVFINWDGTGTNLISSISFNVTLPANVTLPDTELPSPPPDPLPNPLPVPLADPLNFGRANAIGNTVAFVSFAGNVAPLANGDTLLTTLRFNVNAPSGSFPIGLTPESAFQGSIVIPNDFVEITNQVSATGGTLNVSAVPEPSSLALLGLVLGSCGWRRRRSSR